MKIYHNQLSKTLQQGFTPAWLVFGDEPWQKNDSLQQIKQYYYQQGFNELIRFYADDKFDWSELTNEYLAMSLFASQRIIEIELPTGKINEAGNKQILNILEQLHQDVVLIFHGPKLDGATQKRKWFTQLSKQACFLPLYDLEGKQLQQWLYQQSNQLGLKLANEVTELLKTLFSGNLLALAQELEKLSLLFGQQQVSLEQAEPLLINQAKYNPFQLIDSLLIGDLKNCLNMLEAMQNEGIAAGQIIWLLHKEISQLYQMKYALENNVSGQSELFKQYKIWPKKQPIYQQALQQITLNNINIALSRLADVDLISKTSSEFNTFLLLADICLSLHQGDVTKHYPLNYQYA